MSTRSIIARKTKEGFMGTYHHWDGYPTALGFTLYHMYKKGANLNGMLSLLIDDHPAGWSSINGVDWTQPIGYVADYEKGRELNAPQCFCHGDRREEVDEPYTQDTECGAEFAYVFEKDTELEEDIMHVYEKQYEDGEHTTEFFGLTTGRGGWKLIKSINLRGEEPDWEHLGSWGNRE